MNKSVINNSLNDRLGNNGLFFNTETTEQKRSPSEDLMCLKISPGKAYVRGYDVEKISTTIIDVDKPRDTKRVDSTNVPFQMGKRAPETGRHQHRTPGDRFQVTCPHRIRIGQKRRQRSYLLVGGRN